MSAVRMIKRCIAGVFTAALFAGLAGASPALALSSWWHLDSGVRPASLQSGMARDEVQELTVDATGGLYFMGNEESGKYELFKSNATAEEVQGSLEGIYGKGNVEVTGGPGNEGGTNPYVITFVGALADRAIPPLSAFSQTLHNAHGETEPTVTERTQGGNDGQVYVAVQNLGDEFAHGEKVPIKITDALPPGLRAVSIEGLYQGSSGANKPTSLKCSLKPLECGVPTVVAPYETIELQIGVVVEKGASSGEINEVSVTGGETRSASLRRPVRIGGEPSPFGIENYEMIPEEEGGRIDTQAGSHPFQLTTTIALNQTPGAKPRQVRAAGSLVKDLNFKIPPSLIGNPTPFPQCTLGQFLAKIDSGFANLCAPDTVIGVASVTAHVPLIGGLTTFVLPLFNLEPAAGEPARFGFEVEIANAPVILDTSLRTGGDYGITVKVDNVTQTAEFVSSTVTFWGVPGDPRHDRQRSWGCMEALDVITGNQPKANLPCNPLEAHIPPPLLSMPTSCTGPLRNGVEADSWAEEGAFVSEPSVPMPAMDGCNRLPFTPSVIVTPDGRAGSTPTGINVDEHISQLSTLAPEGLAESDVKGLTVTLPEGVAINPAGADGLQACSMEAIGLQSAEPPTCPEASKVGTVKIRTPLLPNPLEGEVYLGEQTANPFGSLIAMYVYAEEPFSKLRAKAAGEVELNPVTGQVTSHFEGDPVFESDPQWAGVPAAQFLPEVPLEDLELHFFGGDRAPLAMPAKCGSYTTTSVFEPWSGNPSTESSSTFEVVSGPNGRPCESSLAFKPALTAGTTSIQAGGFSPFTMTMSREDGEQTLRSIELHMPPGLSGVLTGLKLCGEEQADAGTCGPESEIGETIVSVGVGSDPFSVKGGKVYLTGPYKGAPFGLSIVNPAKAGPFDLGKVIVRAKLEVNPETAALTITTDTSGPYKLPTILDGIPLEIRHVNVDIDRANFVFNPSNCSPMKLTGTLGSTEGANSQVSIPFQVTNCAVLAFKAHLSASASGKVSRVDGTSFTVKLGYPAGPYDANIARVKVELPKGLPSRLLTLQKACVASVFESNPAACPAASIIGHATATTPELPVPLSGPAYFVSHGGEAFPSLVIVLQGYGVTVHLVGTTYISKSGVTSSTFKTVPDAPVGSFELTLPAGPYSALTGLGNICTQKLVMPTEIVGQNGAEIHTNTKIAVTGCAKHNATKKKKKKKNEERKHGKGKAHGG
jgi:hypothetical protein